MSALFNWMDVCGSIQRLEPLEKVALLASASLDTNKLLGLITEIEQNSERAREEQMKNPFCFFRFLFRCKFQINSQLLNFKYHPLVHSLFLCSQFSANIS